MEITRNDAKNENNNNNHGFSSFALITFAEIKDHFFHYKLLFPTVYLEKHILTNEINSIIDKLAKEVN